MRPRNILFASVLCMLLCGPALVGLASWGGVALPSWLTADDAAYLSGGITAADPIAAATVEGFASGEFQEEAEAAVGNCIPVKATALLTSASLQRTAITASNILFHWECYPTFYGSDIAAVPSQGRLVEIAEKATGEILATGERVRDEIDAFSERHPDQHVFVFLGPDSMNIQGSPTAALESDPLTYDQLEAIFEDNDGKFQWISGNITYDEFLDGWHKTDHHWNIQGAFAAYERMAAALGFGDEVLIPSELITYEEPPFRGASARRGLMSSYEDRITDFRFSSFPQLSVTINGSEGTSEDLVHEKAYGSGSWDVNPFANHYADYFHTDYGLVTIRNEESDSDEDLLIVADSYSNCMERFLATHYRTTYVLDPRHLNTTLDEFLTEHEDVSDVLFIMRGLNLLYETTEHALS